MRQTPVTKFLRRCAPFNRRDLENFNSVGSERYPVFHRTVSAILTLYLEPRQRHVVELHVGLGEDPYLERPPLEFDQIDRAIDAPEPGTSEREFNRAISVLSTRPLILPLRSAVRRKPVRPRHTDPVAGWMSLSPRLEHFLKMRDRKTLGSLAHVDIRQLAGLTGCTPQLRIELERTIHECGQLLQKP